MQERWSEEWCTNEEKEGSIPPRGPLSDSVLSLLCQTLNKHTIHLCLHVAGAPGRMNHCNVKILMLVRVTHGNTDGGRWLHKTFYTNTFPKTKIIIKKVLFYCNMGSYPISPVNSLE